METAVGRTSLRFFFGITLHDCQSGKTDEISGMWRRWFAILTVSSLAGMVLLYLNPVHDTIQ